MLQSRNIIVIIIQSLEFNSNYIAITKYNSDYDTIQFNCN